MGEVFCTQCGHRNLPGSRFCSSCGDAIVVGADEHTGAHSAVDAEDPLGVEALDATIAELSPGQAVLVVLGGPGAGVRFELGGGTVRAGRHPDSDLFLDDITVSRRHVEISRHDGRFQVRDVGSLNGTYLNRERIDEAWLQSGDELQIGKFKLLFLSGMTAGPR